MYEAQVMIYYKALWYRKLNYTMNLHNLSLQKLMSVNATMFNGGHGNSA
jgi:hypothetical protein